METIHQPVLTKEVLHCLNPKPNENFIDGTIGEAGHAALILGKNKPEGKLLGIEWDASQIENARLHTTEAKERIILVNDSYENIKEIAERMRFAPVHGILLDLGYSSWQLEQAKRGFSFKRDEVLDMRYSLQNTVTAEKIINEYPPDEIEKILKDFGEEKYARQITKNIVAQRKIKKIHTTFELKELIETVMPKKFHHGRIHVATRTFQALRIAVNRELDNLANVLPQTLQVLSRGGRLVVISFHSLEDRIVKIFFNQEEKRGTIKIITKKPITASAEELLKNPRARSAKLRAAVTV